MISNIHSYLIFVLGCRRRAGTKSCQEQGAAPWRRRCDDDRGTSDGRGPRIYRVSGTALPRRTPRPREETEVENLVLLRKTKVSYKLKINILICVF